MFSTVGVQYVHAGSEDPPSAQISVHIPARVLFSMPYASPKKIHPKEANIFFLLSPEKNVYKKKRAVKIFFNYFSYKKTRRSMQTIPIR